MALGARRATATMAQFQRFWGCAKAGRDSGDTHVFEGGMHFWQVVQVDSSSATAFAKVHYSRFADR